MVELLCEIIEKLYNQKNKNIIIEFLKLEKRFYELIQIDTRKLTKEQLNELTNLGIFLSYRKKNFPYSKNKLMKKDEYFYSLGINSILNTDSIPKNCWEKIKSQELLSISSNSIQKVFKTVYDVFNLISEINNSNGELGLKKYISINEQLLKIKKRTLFDFYSLKLLDMEDIINITSPDSVFNNYKSNDIANKILELKLINKKPTLKNSKNDIIYL